MANDSMSALLEQASQVARDNSPLVKQSAKLEGKMQRQRKKSKELEEDAFGMGLTEVEDLRLIFNTIDKDGSGAIDNSELHTALEYAGKSVSAETVQKLVEKYDSKALGGNGDGMLQFEEYQRMISDWPTIMAEIDAETARFKAAVAAAGEPLPQE